MQELIGIGLRRGKSAYWQLRLGLDHRWGGSWADRLSLKHPDELFRQLRDRTHGNLHRIALLAGDDVLAAPARIPVQKVEPPVGAAALRPHEGGTHDRLGDGQQEAEIARRVPAGIEPAGPRDVDSLGTRPDANDATQALFRL